MSARDAAPFPITQGFSVAEFVALAERVWPREYDVARAERAIGCTVNLGARDRDRLVGSVRLLTDGYLFATVAEILVDPSYQRRGIGRRLMIAVLEHAPRGAIFFGAQAHAVEFFLKIGAERGPVGMVMRRGGS